MRRLAICLLVSGALACQAAPTGESPIQASSAAAVSRVAGSAQIEIGKGTGSAYTQRASFSATRGKNGTVTGHFNVRETFVSGQEPSTYRGRVTCFEIIGNVAYLQGVATGNSPAIPAGNPVSWSVRDNGNGRQGPPDMISAFQTSNGNCVEHFVQPTFDSEQGNIEVQE